MNLSSFINRKVIDHLTEKQPTDDKKLEPAKPADKA
jgi:hypothetical protein